jgi:hypothetical protein
MAEANQLALDPSVTPGRILAGHAQHQGPDGLRDGWTTRLSSRVGPAVDDEVGVPAQQGSLATRAGAGAAGEVAVCSAR